MAQVFLSFSVKDHDRACEFGEALKLEGVHSVFFSGDQDTGIEAGKYWEEVLYTELRRCRIFVPLLSPNWVASTWCNVELRIARMQGADIVPVEIATCERKIVDEIQKIRADGPKGNMPSELAKLVVHKLRRRKGSFGATTLFAGIRPVDVDRAALFSGRDVEIADLHNLVNRATVSTESSERVILLAGASGVGKSSLLRAGLIGDLRAENHFLIFGPIRPSQGVEGYGESVANALAETLNIKRTDALDLFKQGPKEVIAAIGEAMHAMRARALLVAIDQGEELDRTEAAQFRRLVMAILTEPHLPAAVTIAVRDDMAVRLQSVFGGLLQPLQSMKIEQLSDALREPLELGGRLDPDANKLVDVILRDAVGANDMLPLAAFVMATLERENDFTPGRYELLGGLRGVIEREAESVWHEKVVPSELEADMRQLFVPGMISIDEMGLPRLGQMRQSAIALPLMPAVDALVERRLLHRIRIDDPVVEPAHETFLRQWPRLAQWLIEEQQSLSILASALRDAGAWVGGGKRNSDLLHRGDRLEALRALSSEDAYSTKLGADALEYLSACLKAEDEATSDRQAREQAVALGVQRIAAVEADRAYEAENYSSAMRLGLAGWVLGSRLSNYADPALGRILTTAYARDRQQLRLTQPGYVRNAMFSVDGMRVVTAAGDGTVRIWNAATGKEIGSPMLHDDVVFSAMFSPDGLRVVTASYDGASRAWDIASGALIGSPMRHSNWLRSAEFSHDGMRVLTAADDGAARVWDVTRGTVIGTPMLHNDWVSSAAFSPDGTRVATASYDGTAKVWDASSGKQIGSPMLHNDVVTSAMFSLDGMRVVTSSDDGSARIWEAASGQPIGQRMQHRSGVLSAIFSPDGARVVTVAHNGTAQVWDAGSGAPVGDPVPEQNLVLAAMLSPSAARKVTATAEDTTKIRIAWPALPAQGDLARAICMRLIDDAELTDEEAALTLLPDPPRNPVKAALEIFDQDQPY